MVSDVSGYVREMSEAKETQKGTLGIIQLVRTRHQI